MLQDPDLIIHRLRLRYLSQMQDGIGERIIDFSRTKTSSVAFRIAGGDPALMDRCVSPDIPTQDANDFNMGGVSRVDLVNKSQESIRGEALNRTFTNLTLDRQTKSIQGTDALPPERIKHLMKDYEASDQSDISDTEENLPQQTYDFYQKHLTMIDIHKRISEEPKFQKIPVRSRQRGVSDTSVTYNRLSALPLPRRPTISQHNSESDGHSRFGDQSGFSSDSGMLLPALPHETGAGFQSIPPSPPIIELSADFIDSLAGLGNVYDQNSISDSEYDMNDVRFGGLELSENVTNKATEIRDDSKTHRKRNSLRGIPTVLPLVSTLLKTIPRPESMQLSSSLTAMIKASESNEVNPLEQLFGILSGKGDLKPLKLKIYRPSSTTPSKPFSVIIKSSATVLDTIGYSLLRYSQEELMPKLTPEQMDPNYWTLRIVEDDGELDEDFPALERMRPISKFSFDEFALVEATTAQVKENQSLTPTSLLSKRTLNSIPEVQPSFKPSTNTRPAIGLVTANGGQSTVITSVNTPIGSVKAVARAPGASVLLKIKLGPETLGTSTQYAQSTMLDVTTETYLGDVLDQVCKRRNLDKFMFCLRLAGSNVIVPSDRTVESLQGRTELLLVRKKAMDLFTDSTLPRSMTPNAPIVAAAASSAKLGGGLSENSGLSRYLPDIVTPSTYQRWIVWRRQPMSFMGRHERVLAIDGEYVHISPSESKTMFESPKTSSLHVGQIIACKQSRKLPVNFKITIIKAGQTKRYDFEAGSVREAETVVSKIRTLTRNYALRIGSRTSRLGN